MENLYTINLDIKKPGYIPEPVCKQNDYVTFLINLYDNGTPIVLTDAMYVTVGYERPDGKNVVVMALRTSGNQVKVVTNRPENSLVGLLKSTIQVYNNNVRISTFSFNIRVERDPSLIIPNDEDKTLIQQVLGQGPVIIEGLEKIVIEAEQATVSANTAANKANEAADKANQATLDVAQAIEDTNTAAALANNAAVTANNAAQSANTAAQTANQAVENVNQVITDAEQATTNANNAADNATLAETMAKAATQDAITATNNANTATTAANDAATAANLAANDTRDAIADANSATTAANAAATNANDKATLADTAATNANDAANNANLAAESVKGWGLTVEWDATTNFMKKNTVSYNGSTWQSTIDNNKNSVPSETNSNWILIAQRGVDGTGSVSTVAGKGPDSSGNVNLLPIDIGADTSTQVDDKINVLHEQLKEAGYDAESLTTISETELVVKATSGIFYVTPDSSTFLPLDKSYVGELSINIATNIETRIYSLTDLETAKTYTRVVVTDTSSSTVTSDTQWIEGGGGGGGSVRTEVYPYTLETTVESQKTWDIPVGAFDRNSDSMMVFHNTVYLAPTSWNTTGEPSNAKLNIPDNPEVAIDDNKVYIVVFKNLPMDVNTTISGTLLTPNSVSMAKLGSDVKQAIQDAANDNIVIAEKSATELPSTYPEGLTTFIPQTTNDSWKTLLGAEHISFQVLTNVNKTALSMSETQTIHAFNNNAELSAIYVRGGTTGDTNPRWGTVKKIYPVPLVDSYSEGGTESAASAESVKNLYELLQYHGVATENIQHITDVEMLNSKSSGCFVVAVTGTPSTIMPVGLGIFITYIAQHIDSNGNALRSFICSHAATGNMYSRNVRMQSIEDDTILQDSGWVNLFTRIADNVTTNDPLQVLSASAGKRLSDYVNENINYLRARMSLFNIERRQPDANGKYVEILYKDPNNTNNIINSLLAKSAPTVQNYDRLTWNGEISGIVVDYTWILQYDSKNTVVEKATLVL